MPDPAMPHRSSKQRLRALSRWENEGGATASTVPASQSELPEMTNTELVQLRIRVIAMENMLIAVLSEGSDRQLQVARDMAGFISPREGCTPHPLTIKAADHMTDLVDRAVHFRTVPRS